jgi:hypothetical protein
LRKIGIAVELHGGDVVVRARPASDRQALAGFAVYQQSEVAGGKRGVDRRAASSAAASSLAAKRPRSDNKAFISSLPSVVYSRNSRAKKDHLYVEYHE